MLLGTAVFLPVHDNWELREVFRTLCYLPLLEQVSSGILPRQSLLCSSGRKSRSMAGERADLPSRSISRCSSVHWECSVHCRDPSHGGGTARLPVGAAVLWSTLPVCCRLFITPCLSTDEGAEWCSSV